MILDNTWELMSIIEHYNERIKDADFRDKDAIEELYAQAIRLQCNEDYGYIITIDDFIEDVRHGSFVDYDGSGVFLDWEGNRQEYICCDIEWLQQNKKDYHFIKWFNK